MPEAGILYGYFRSSAAYRVRIAINLKGLAVEQRAVHLRKGEQHDSAFVRRNPAGLVPFWSEHGFGLSQSLAIIEYLDECFPEPPLLPGSARDRAIIRELALTIAADIHPLGNLRVLDKLTSDYGADEAARAAWCRTWIERGFEAVEKRLASTPGQLCYGDAPTLADTCLVPQMFNARRFGVDLTRYPLMVRTDAALAQIEAFQQALPSRQPDAE
ncbi:MAG: maleylacetoacetate isomerase [Beijerinckiaceae bacterium]|jgi:maleylpyruvate isomerase|nr:maleylacetoacetate isomerase [Beijerinckiaceae bacterium]